MIDDPKRILFVEDDTSVREGVTAALESFGYEVRPLVDGTGLAEVMDDFQPHLALLDVSLPRGPDGFELAATIRARSTVPVFFLTAADSIENRLRGFDLGADDYLVKPFSTRELAARLRAVLRRSGSEGDDAILAAADVKLDLNTRSAWRGDNELRLTPTEFDLLATLAASPQRVWPKRALMLEVWGTDVHAPHLVEVHISALRRKLEAHGPRLIVTRRDGGYSLVR